MNKKRAIAIVLAGLSALLIGASASEAKKSPVTSVGGFSSQVSKNKATTGASIKVSTQTANSGSSSPGASSSGGSPASADQVVVPTLAADSPLLQNEEPGGPGTFWYQESSGISCIYVPDASPDCYAIVAPAAPALPDVSGMTAQLAAQLDLTLAGIDASPSASSDGLTGAETWFWLAAAPGGQQLSLTLDGETVIVSADPSQISWSFGDGISLDAGPGIPYQAGAVPTGAVTHVYQTRCLPGDQGRDPYVLPSCEPDGYQVTASTTWAISFTASGPVSENGDLPSQTTQSQLVYPVNEVRSFLTGGPA